MCFEFTQQVSIFPHGWNLSSISTVSLTDLHSEPLISHDGEDGDGNNYLDDISSSYDDDGVVFDEDNNSNSSSSSEGGGSSNIQEGAVTPVDNHHDEPSEPMCNNNNDNDVYTIEKKTTTYAKVIFASEGQVSTPADFDDDKSLASDADD